MDLHGRLPDDRPVFDAQREWAIYRCGHGCLHVVLDRLTLTLTDEEFHALQALMRRACARFHGEGLPSIGVLRAN